INPDAVAMQRKTAEFNKIEHLVNIYHSDCFDSIPDSEKWDLVVSNPPHFPLDYVVGNTPPGEFNLKAHDPDWELHKKFYAGIKKFMKPGGHVVIQENTQGGQSLETFKEMIVAGGGEVVSYTQSVDVCGRGNPMYYLVSKW
ncbi:MAG: methyltransferase, partial [Rubripirellula sp.]